MDFHLWELHVRRIVSLSSRNIKEVQKVNISSIKDSEKETKIYSHELSTDHYMKHTLTNKLNIAKVNKREKM